MHDRRPAGIGWGVFCWRRVACQTVRFAVMCSESKRAKMRFLHKYSAILLKFSIDNDTEICYN